MANFPNSVTVYTTRNPGDVIPSADWDSFGAEITAIEDGLINGTAPIHSSNTTVNNLQINGSVTGTRIACTLTHTASQNVNSGPLTGLNFDTESSDPGSMHSTVSNSSRINFPVAGTYLVGAYVTWVGSTAGTARQVNIVANNVSIIGAVLQNPTAGSQQTVSVLYTPASTTEFATIAVAQDSGSTMSISSGVTSVRAWAALIGV